MCNYIELLNSKFDTDKKAFIKKSNYEKVFVLEMAKIWIPENTQSLCELSKATAAMGAILGSDEFQKTIAISKEMRASKAIDPQKCEEMATLITKLSESETYLKNTDTAVYKILDKFKDPETYKTDAFANHANIMTLFHKYLCETERYIRENTVSE